MKCGKELPEGAQFCPNCGNKTVLGKSTANDTISKVSETVVNSAKSITEKINDTTNGKAKDIADGAKQTAKEFVGDIKQVAQDKNTSNFFKKNKYRNTKILVVIFLLFCMCISFFDDDSSEKSDGTTYYWLSKAPSTNINIRISENDNWTEGLTCISAEDIPDNNIWKMDNSRRVEFYGNGSTFLGYKDHKEVASITIVTSQDKFYMSGQKEKPLMLDIPDSNYDIYAYKANDGYLLFFVYPEENYENSIIKAMIGVSDPKYNEFTNESIGVKVLNE